MLIRYDEHAEEIRHQMRGGEGDIQIRTIAKGDSLPPNTRLMAQIIVKPGCSIGCHEHTGEAEIFHILSGKGTVDDNGTKVDVAPGDTIITGNGAYHSVENHGDEPLVMLAVIVLGA